MSNFKRLTILIICVLSYLSLPATAGTEKDAILNTFKMYKQALKAKNGVQAASLVSTQTIGYYEKLRTRILNANAVAVKSSRIMEKVAILTFRQRMNASDLRRMNGKKLFIHSVNKGWVSKDSIKNVGIGDISINGDVAFANVVSRGKKRKTRVPFSKESGSWKVDLITTMNDMAEEMDAGLRRLAKIREMSEDDLVIFLVEGSTGMKVTPKLWDGPHN